MPGEGRSHPAARRNTDSDPAPGSGKTPAPATTGKAKPPASSPTPAPAPKDVSYKNCTEAKAAGAAPIRRGQPGYGEHLDRDNDGIACDT